MPLYQNRGKPRPINELNSMKIILGLGRLFGFYPTCDVTQWRVFLTGKMQKTIVGFYIGICQHLSSRWFLMCPTPENLMSQPEAETSPPRALWQVSRQDLAILCECSIDTVNHWFQYAKSFLIKLYCRADKFLLILNGQSY